MTDQTATELTPRSGSPLRAEISTEVTLCNNYSSFNFNLWLRLIEDRDQLTNGFDIFFHVGND